VERSGNGSDYRRSGGKNSATQPGGQPDEGNSPNAVVGSATIDAGSTADARPAADTGGNTAAAVRNDAHEQHYIVRFAAGSELVRRIEAARSLLSFRLPANASLEDVLGAVLDEFIDRNDPSRRAARREKREGRAKRKDERERKSKDTAVARNPRAIPEAVRDRAMAEAGGRCQYVSRRGRRCDATAFLQVDHIVPVGLGGTADPANLRVLCARHNRSEAARLLGRDGGTRAKPRREW
jgi:5-methylcytosine-specific restriction endonuclease McrA